MNKYELEALGNFTCDYPEGKTFEEVLELIEAESEDVVIWEPFEYHPAGEVAEMISNMADSLKRTFKE